MMSVFLAHRLPPWHAPLAVHLALAVVSVAVAFSILPDSAVAQERLTTDLTINQLIQQVLERNEGIQGRILEVAIARKKYQAEKGVFEPDFVASYDRVENKRQIGLQEKTLGQVGQVFDEKNNIYNTGLESLIPTGARIKLGYTLRDNLNNINPAPFASPLDFLTNEWVSFAGLSATQPLLKNFGFTPNLAGIRLAALGSEIAFQEYRRQLMVLISTAEATYWNLYMAQEQMLFFKESVAVAESIRNDNQTRLKAGRGSELEVMEADSGLALRKSKQSDARDPVADAHGCCGDGARVISLGQYNMLELGSCALANSFEDVHKKELVTQV